MTKPLLLVLSLVSLAPACTTTGGSARAPSALAVAPADSPAALVEALPNEPMPERRKVARVTREEREREMVRPRPRR